MILLYTHFHTSRYIDISYLYTIPWQTSLLNVGLEDARDARLLLSANLSIWVQWIHDFLFPFQWRICFVYDLRDLLLLVPSNGCGTNQIEARHLVQRLLSTDCVVVRYHYTLTCGDVCKVKSNVFRERSIQGIYVSKWRQ